METAAVSRLLSQLPGRPLQRGFRFPVFRQQFQVLDLCFQPALFAGVDKEDRTFAETEFFIFTVKKGAVVGCDVAVEGGLFGKGVQFVQNITPCSDFKAFLLECKVGLGNFDLRDLPVAARLSVRIG